jgi:hypothetical protein
MSTTSNEIARGYQRVSPQPRRPEISVRTDPIAYKKEQVVPRRIGNPTGPVPTPRKIDLAKRTYSDGSLIGVAGNGRRHFMAGLAASMLNPKSR